MFFISGKLVQTENHKITLFFEKIDVIYMLIMKKVIQEFFPVSMEHSSHQVCLQGLLIQY
jgi:hypothetical protein